MNRNIKREKKIENYDAVRIGIASPEAIRSWSYGEVIKPDTLNYRTHKPEKDGLFCERIFGPEKDYECSCGKYKKKRFSGTVCDRCGVEVTSSRVRRTRMGHIELSVPVAHISFVKSAPSKIGTLLGLTITNLEKILVYESYVVMNPGEQDYVVNELIDTEEYYEIRDQVSRDADFVAKIGAEAIREMLQRLNLDDLAADLRTRIKWETSTMRKQKMIKRLKIVEAFRQSGNKPEWMILEVLPVLPPTLRPLVPLDGGRFATADFNDLYRRVITRNNRLRDLIEIRAPEVILRNEKRMLQEAVDALIDNSRKARPVKGRGNRALKSLTDQLKGKQGRFRQNLLGKRVDYSGRSVITVGPHLKIYEMGLPKEMAVELFKPFIIERLEKLGAAEKTKTAKKMVEKKQPEIWKILEEVVKDYPVLLNRAPTLHRLGIQAFMPVLTEGKSLQLHPMVCTPFNADFDGDQMGCYIPLSHEARIEARVLMLSSRNLLLPASGRLAMAPSQDIVLGCYYLTMQGSPRPDWDKDVAELKLRHNELFAKADLTEEEATELADVKDQLKSLTDKTFRSVEQLVNRYEREEMFFDQKRETEESRNLDIGDRSLSLNTWIKIYVKDEWIITTVGRVLFNTILPDVIPFQNKVFDKGALNDLSMDCFHTVGQWETALFLDRMKEIGLKYATRGGITFSFGDIIVPEKKNEIIARTQKIVDEITDSYSMGVITDSERSSRVVDSWKIATEEVTDTLMDEMAVSENGYNSIYMMYLSGARGSKTQIKQLGGMRGLMDKPSSKGAGAEVIETPIKSNFKEGLSVLEFFISAHGSRKGLADTALKTAGAGYLTRRLVDVAQNAMIVEDDCGTIDGIEVSALKEGNEVIESLEERISGRTAVDDIEDPRTGEIIVEGGDEISNAMARRIQKHGVLSVRVRSVLTCQTDKGICAKCYGRNLSTHKPVSIGEPVGIIAAQSIGEPGTQLTLRTFHIGGTASTDVDSASVHSKHDGYIKFDNVQYVVDNDGQMISSSHLGKIYVVPEPDSKLILEEYKVEYAAFIEVKDGQRVVANSRLFSWDQYNNPLISTVKGVLTYDNFDKNVTYKEEFNDLTGSKEITIIESKNRTQPQFKIETDDGQTVLVPLQTGLSVLVEDKQTVQIGQKIGQTSRVTIKQSDITGGLPRVEDLFEARIPKEKAIISEIEGRISIGNLKRNGRDIFITPPTGIFAIEDGIMQVVDDLPQIATSNIIKSGNETLAPISGTIISLEVDGKLAKVTIKDDEGNVQSVECEDSADIGVLVYVGQRVHANDAVAGAKNLMPTIRLVPVSGVKATSAGKVAKIEKLQDGYEVTVVPRTARKKGEDVYFIGGEHKPFNLLGSNVKKGEVLGGYIHYLPPGQEAILATGTKVTTGLALAGRKHVIPLGKRIIIHEGDNVNSGTALCDGPIDPHDVLRIRGIKEAQKLILDEIQEVYRKQGVKIDDKHIGVIVRQMFRKVKILDPGDTYFLEGDTVEKLHATKENEKQEELGGKGATFEQLLLGITKTSLLTESWLSAASFQETTKVLTQAAVEGKVDNLEGLKESIILGHKIPVGTGSKFYTRQIKELENSGKTVAEMVELLAHQKDEKSDDDFGNF